MKWATISAIDPVGSYIRPATAAISTANRFKCGVNVSLRGREMNVKSIVSIISLGVSTQSEITISCNDDDEDATVVTIEKVLRVQKIIG